MQVKIERKVGVVDLGSNTFNIKFVTFKNREVRSIFKYKKYINIFYDWRKWMLQIRRKHFLKKEDTHPKDTNIISQENMINS